jgi:predicted O-methyltransferase YrrM
MVWTRHIPGENDQTDYQNVLGYIDVSDAYIYGASYLKILLQDYGFAAALELSLPIDAQGNEIPLYTHPTIEYLNQFDFSDKSVFEYGSGHSTLYWAKRAKSVKAVEHTVEWQEKLLSKLQSYSIDWAQVFCPANDDEYVDYILKFDEDFDIIIIDGVVNRYECAENALKKLKKGGIIILDNAEWHFNTAKLLRDANLIQVDFSGFKATDYHTSTTSLFLDRDVKLVPKNDRQPSYPLGAVKGHSTGWDFPREK